MMIDWFPLILSLRVSIISTFVVVLVGTLLSYLFSRKEFKGKTLVESLIMLPLILPPTVVGFILIYLFGKNGPLGSALYHAFGFSLVFHWHGAVLAAILVSLPLMVQSGQAAFSRVEVSLEEAARTMGASEWRIFWSITLPLALPGLFSGVILAFARALGEFGATLMVAGYIPRQTETLPLAIYFAAERGDYRTAGFWTLMISLLGMAAIGTVNWLKRKRRIGDG